jgi:hypothetical protein
MGIALGEGVAGAKRCAGNKAGSDDELTAIHRRSSL